MPSWRKRREVSAVDSVGESALPSRLSWAVNTTSVAARKPSTSKSPSVLRKARRLIDARLQAELSRCMYSLHGFEPLIRPVLDDVCHRLIVVSNCMPGSAHCHE